MPQSDIGLIGLAVMGQNLALNIADHGFAISVFNRSTDKTLAFVAAHAATPGALTGYATMQEFSASLKKPRKAVILVKAGAATDAVIDELARVFEPGDIIIDGGNANWLDTIRRERDLKARLDKIEVRSGGNYHAYKNFEDVSRKLGEFEQWREEAKQIGRKAAFRAWLFCGTLLAAASIFGLSVVLSGGHS